MPGYRKAKSLLIFYLNTYIIPFGAMLIIGLIIYKHMPPDLKAQVFNDRPDGRIAFASNRDGNWELYTINPDGTELTRLTNTPDAQEYWPAWSPDGRRIAFTHTPADNEGTKDICIVNTDGTNMVNLTRGIGDNDYPTWYWGGASGFRDGPWFWYQRACPQWRLFKGCIAFVKPGGHILQKRLRENIIQVYITKPWRRSMGFYKLSSEIGKLKSKIFNDLSTVITEAEVKEAIGDFTILHSPQPFA